MPIVTMITLSTERVKIEFVCVRTRDDGSFFRRALIRSHKGRSDEPAVGFFFRCRGKTFILRERYTSNLRVCHKKAYFIFVNYSQQYRGIFLTRKLSNVTNNKHSQKNIHN